MSAPTLERPARYPGAPAAPRQTAPPLRPLMSVPTALLAALCTFFTSLCLGNLFDGLGWWLLPTSGAIALASVVGAISRRLHAPALLIAPWVYLVAGWCYVIPVGTSGSQLRSPDLARPDRLHLRRAARPRRCRRPRHPHPDGAGAGAPRLPVPHGGRRLPRRSGCRRRGGRSAPAGRSRSAAAGPARRPGRDRRTRGRAARLHRRLRQLHRAAARDRPPRTARLGSAVRQRVRSTASFGERRRPPDRVGCTGHRGCCSRSSSPVTPASPATAAVARRLPRSSSRS